MPDMKPNVRSYFGRLALIAIGICIGAIGMLAGIRASRNPDGFLYAIRARMGAAPRDTSEANWLARRYGPDKQSMNFEEWIVRDFFRGRKNGTFKIGRASCRERV